MDIDYSPTGREFVSGSYDRTVSFLTLYAISSLQCLNDGELWHLTELTLYRLEFSSIMVVEAGKSITLKECKGFCLVYHLSWSSFFPFRPSVYGIFINWSKSYVFVWTSFP